MSRTVKKKSTVRSRTKALVGNYKRCTVKDVHEHIKFVMSDKDVHDWYFLLGIIPDSKSSEGQFSGNNNEFIGGQFLGKITATMEYPYGPPDVEMLTPTGIFPMNNNDFCIDIGKYHKNDYPATLGMDGYVKMIWSGLMGWEELGNGIGLKTGKSSYKKLLCEISSASSSSIEYNKKHNSRVLELFKNSTV